MENGSRPIARGQIGRCSACREQMRQTRDARRAAHAELLLTGWAVPLSTMLKDGLCGYRRPHWGCDTKLCQHLSSNVASAASPLSTLKKHPIFLSDSLSFSLSLHSRAVCVHLCVCVCRCVRRCVAMCLCMKKHLWTSLSACVCVCGHHLPLDRYVWCE